MLRKRLTFLILLLSTQLSQAQTTWDDLPIDVMVQIFEDVLIAGDKNEAALPLVTKTTNKYLGRHTSLFVRELKRLSFRAETFCPIQYLLDQSVWTQPDIDQYQDILNGEVSALIEYSATLNLQFTLLIPKIRAMPILAIRRQKLVEFIEALMTKKYYPPEPDDEDEDNEKENLEGRVDRLATIPLMPLDYALTLFRRVHREECKTEQKDDTRDGPKSKRARIEHTTHRSHRHLVPNLINTLKNCPPSVRSNALRRVCESDAEVLEVYTCLTDNFNLRFSQ